MSYQFPTSVDLRGRPGATGLTVGHRLAGTAGGSAAVQAWAASFAEVPTQPGLYLPSSPGGTIALPDGYSGPIFYGTNPATPAPTVDVAAEVVGPGTYENQSRLLGVDGSAGVQVAGFAAYPDLLGQFAGDYADGAQAAALDAAGDAFAAKVLVDPSKRIAADSAGAVAASNLSGVATAAAQQTLATAVAAIPTSPAGLTQPQAQALAQIPGLVAAVAALPTAASGLTQGQATAVAQIPALATTVSTVSAQVAALQPVTLDGGVVAAVPAPGAAGFAAAGVNLVQLAGGYVSQSVVFQTGALQGLRREIAGHAFNGVSHQFTLVAPLPLAPAQGDAFVIL